MLPQATPQTDSKSPPPDDRQVRGEEPPLSFAELRDRLKASAELPVSAERLDLELVFQRQLALPRSENTPDSIEVLIELAKNFFFMAQPEKALHAASHAALMAEIQGERTLLRKARGVQGLLFSDLGRFGEAMTAHVEALTLARAAGNKRAEVIAINGIGGVCAGSGQWRLAIQYLTRACELAEENDAHDIAMTPRCNIADCAIQLREPALGLNALAMVENWVPRIKIEFTVAAKARNMLARLNLMIGEIATARLHAQEGARLARIANTEKSILENEVVLGLIDVSSGEAEKGLAMIERAVAFARRFSHIELADYLGICIEAYEAAGHSDIALVYLHELVAWKKSAFRVEDTSLKYDGLIEPSQFEADISRSDDGLLAKAHVLQTTVHQRIARLAEAAINAEMIGGHDLYRTFRLAKLARCYAEAKSWDKQKVSALALGAQLCNIGMISVPARVLQKSRGLSVGERHVLRDHTRYGGQLLADSKLRVLSMGTVIAEQHHERHDGSGYPRGLSGDAIAEEAQIVSVCDAFDAMTHSRPWRPVPLSVPAALNEIERGAGKQFDPHVAKFFAELIRCEFWKHDDWDKYLAEDADESEYVRARARIEALIGTAR